MADSWKDNGPAAHPPDFYQLWGTLMARKKYDMAVKTGSYTDRDGKQKNRYQNIGVVMQSDDGGHYALLDPLINLAAVPREQGKDRVMVSLFEPRDDAQQQAPQRQQRHASDDSSIPF